MKIILWQDVSRVGRKYEIKEVADGYGRNVLLARGLAVLATKENLARTEGERKARADELKLKRELIEKGLQALNGLEIRLVGKASAAGHLFAGIHPDEIVKMVKKIRGVDLETDWIVLPKPIKTIGEHEVRVKIGEQGAKIKVVVEAV